MKKLKTLESFLEFENKMSIKDKMMSGDIQLIEQTISSDNNLGCVLAIGASVKNQIKTDIIVRSLKKLKSKDEYEFCMNISELALAALHVLGIEYYYGDNKNVKELIESKFSFI